MAQHPRQALRVAIAEPRAWSRRRVGWSLSGRYTLTEHEHRLRRSLPLESSVLHFGFASTHLEKRHPCIR
jgi:hypothetical protein